MSMMVDIDLNDDVPTCRICHCTDSSDLLSDESESSNQSHNFKSVNGGTTTNNNSNNNNNNNTTTSINNSPSSNNLQQCVTTILPDDSNAVTLASEAAPLNANDPQAGQHQMIYINVQNSTTTSTNAKSTLAKESPLKPFYISPNSKSKQNKRRRKDAFDSRSLSKDDYQLNKLISPCHCSGSLKWVHHNCLQQWLSATNSQRCELCKYQFSMTVKYKPLHKWGALNTTANDRRRLICNSVFNLVSMVCVFWSIYVLIERASQDAHKGQIDWSFWTKMCVITIGFIGGVIFLFVQLRLYFSIFIRWRQANRIIIIRNANLNNNASDTQKSAPSDSTRAKQ